MILSMTGFGRGTAVRNGREISARVGVANVNLSKLKTGKVSAIRFSTLEAICAALHCQPGDILEYQPPEPPCEGDGGVVE